MKFSATVEWSGVITEVVDREEQYYDKTAKARASYRKRQVHLQELEKFPKCAVLRVNDAQLDLIGLANALMHKSVSVVVSSPESSDLGFTGTLVSMKEIK